MGTSWGPHGDLMETSWELGVAGRVQALPRGLTQLLATPFEVEGVSSWQTDTPSVQLGV